MLRPRWADAATEATHGLAMPKTSPLCAKCKLPLAPDKKFQLHGKSLGKFKCSTCNTRGVQLSRRGLYEEFLASHKGIGKYKAADFGGPLVPRLNQTSSISCCKRLSRN